MESVEPGDIGRHSAESGLRSSRSKSSVGKFRAHVLHHSYRVAALRASWITTHALEGVTRRWLP